MRAGGRELTVRRVRLMRSIISKQNTALAQASLKQPPEHRCCGAIQFFCCCCCCWLLPPCACWVGLCSRENSCCLLMVEERSRAVVWFVRCLSSLLPCRVSFGAQTNPYRTSSSSRTKQPHCGIYSHCDTDTHTYTRISICVKHGVVSFYYYVKRFPPKKIVLVYV